VLAAAVPALAAEPLTVMLDWFVNPDHAPLLIAQDKGFFAKQGLDVNLVAPSNPNDPPKLVAAGKADLAVSYQPQLYLQAEQGLPLVRIATLVATPLNALVVLADGPITTLADLKGKTIGYSIGGFETVLLSTLLATQGLKTQDVTLVNVQFALSQSLLSGQVQGVIGAFRNFELNQLAIENRPARAFFVEEHGVPAYDELIVVAHRDRLTDKRLRAFVDGLEEGIQFLINHPRESWHRMVNGRKELDNELNRRAFADTLPRFALRPGALDTARYRRFADFCLRNGLIKTAPPVERLALELP
jgi:putative hydroxymethylpyrimidine transport system substrate-binding protein